MNDGAVKFLEGLLQAGIRLLRGQHRLPSKVLEAFSAVHLIDSTLLSLPANLQDLFAGYGGKASVAAAKVQLSFDYLHGTFTALTVAPGRTPDQNCALIVSQARPGSLSIFDLGFFKQETFKALADAQAYFVSRFQVQTAVYLDEQAHQQLDLLAYLRRQMQSQGELCAYIGSSVRLKVRLIFQKVPEAVVEQRRRRAYRAAAKKGKSPSADSLAWLAWSVFITNVPQALLALPEVPLVYAIRWQVELLFKLFKSQARLNQIAPCRPQRFLCQLYARLLGVLIFQWLAAPCRAPAQPEFSFPIAFNLFKRFSHAFLQAIISSWSLLPALLAQLTEDFLRFARQQSRKKSPSSLHRLHALRS
jgi:hypothetical protein